MNFKLQVNSGEEFEGTAGTVRWDDVDNGLVTQTLVTTDAELAGNLPTVEVDTQYRALFTVRVAGHIFASRLACLLPVR